MTPFLHIKNVSDKEGLTPYCRKRLNKYLSTSWQVENVYCKLARCHHQKSMYTCFIAVELQNGVILETEVHHFFHHKAFDQALRNAVRKLTAEGLEQAS